MSSAECPTKAEGALKRTPRSQIRRRNPERSVTKKSFELLTFLCTRGDRATEPINSGSVRRVAAASSCQPTAHVNEEPVCKPDHLSQSVPYRSPNTSHQQAASTHKKQEALLLRRPSRIALSLVVGGARAWCCCRPDGGGSALHQHTTPHTPGAAAAVATINTRIPNAVNARAARALPHAPRALPHARPRAGRAAAPPPLALALVALRRRGAAPAPAEPGPAGQVRPALDVEPSGALALCVVVCIGVDRSIG